MAYKESEEEKRLKLERAALEANRPDKEPYKYDLNGDALYKQLRERYIQDGKTAMEDTVGQVSALSGGYANSYAQTAGQQTYNKYLTQLSDLAPTLEQAAYARYKDKVDDYKSERSYLDSLYDAAYRRNYDKYVDDRNYKLSAASRYSGSSGKTNPTYNLLTGNKYSEFLESLNDIYSMAGIDGVNAAVSAAANNGEITTDDALNIIARYQQDAPKYTVDPLDKYRKNPTFNF